MLAFVTAKIANLKPCITGRYKIIDVIHKQIVGREGIITSGNDGLHMVGSKHYTDEAIDLRVKDIVMPLRKKLAEVLALQLGKDYDVLLKSNPPHIHIEYDPK